MKIGVITTHYTPNYGALLQTYALQQHLKGIYGTENVEAIDYVPPAFKKQHWKLVPLGKNWKDYALLGYLLLHPKYLTALIRQNRNMKQFIAQHLSYSKNCPDEESIQQLRDAYNAVICGSDQVWNLHLVDCPAYFLDFAKNWTNVRRIAYAPSIADPIPDSKKESVKTYLSNIDALSVREKSDVQQLSGLTEKEIHHVCDPVFLLPAEEWKRMLPQRQIRRPYIMCYFLNPREDAMAAVNKIRQLTGLPVVYVNTNILSKLDADVEVRDASPLDFLQYILNAEYVCTNSFHCTAFSVIFKKNLCVVRKPVANARMESLLEKANLSQCLKDRKQIEALNAEDLKIDYADSDCQDWIDYSKQYLLNAIEASSET